MRQAPGRPRRRFSLSSLLLLILGTLALPATAFAQGKISGTVLDGVSGDPLPGVNVFIDGTQQGTSTNGDGDYVILNVRPGTYTLVFSFIGFNTKRIEDVRVATGQTTSIDAELGEAVFEGEEVIVQAERPLVQKDLTASKKTVDAETIAELPVESFFGVLTTQAGVSQGANGAIHIRGGRSNEVAYLVDGMSVGNPFETNGLATGVARDAIEEMTVISGAFNAEYGKAMSGIVNLVTKEGDNSYKGSITAYGGDSFSTHDDIFMTPGSAAIRDYVFEGSFSGPVPFFKRMKFFVSGRRSVDGGHIFGVRQHLPSDRAQFNLAGDERARMVEEIQQFLPDYDPSATDAVSYYELHGVPWYEIASNETLADSIAGVSDIVSMNDSRSYNLLSKFTLRTSSSTKLQYSLLIDGSERTSFSFGYRFNPDGLPKVRDWSTNHSLHWTHTLGDRAFYTLRLSYAQNRFRVGTYEDPFDPRYVPDLSGTGDGPVRGLPSGNFLFAGNAKGQTYENADSWRGKFDFTRQFGVRHEVRFGLDAQRHSLERENFTVLYDQQRYLQPTVENVNTAARDKYGCTEFFDMPDGADYFYPLERDTESGSEAADCEAQTVLELSAYVQDKIEFEDFIINAGLRYERFDPNGVYIPDLLALDDYVLVDDGANPDDLLPLEDAGVKNLLLPRLGVSFPITERGIIHFSYGHFAQMPRLRDMYRNPELEFPANSTPTFGNPNMRPERTVQYEIGLQQQLTNTLAFDITGYFKNIRDYLTLQRIQYSTIAGQESYRIYRNKDYANIKGITFSLTKRRAPQGLVSATIDYTFQVAEGNDDRADAFFFNSLSGKETEFEIVPLDFDQTSIISGTVSISRPGNWGISFIGQYATGYPYSPQILDQNLDLRSNSDNKPNLIQLDSRIFKQFEIGGARVMTFLQAYNLLDILNERYVFDDTGRATYTLNGGLEDPHAAWTPYYGQPGIQTLDVYNTRPQWYSSPRSIRLGLTLGF